MSSYIRGFRSIDDMAHSIATCTFNHEVSEFLMRDAAMYMTDDDLLKAITLYSGSPKLLDILVEEQGRRLRPCDECHL